MKRFPVLYMDKPVGYAELEKQGMFYRVHCNCDLPQDRLYKITMTVQGNQIDLGICARIEKGIGMVKRIAAATLENKELHFEAEQGNIGGQTKIQVSEDSDFPALESLENARFFRINGNAYIRLH